MWHSRPTQIPHSTYQKIPHCTYQKTEKKYIFQNKVTKVVNRLSNILCFETNWDVINSCVKRLKSNQIEIFKRLDDESVGSGEFWLIISHTQREYSAGADIKMQNGFVQIAK